MQRITTLAVLIVVWGFADRVSASDHTGIYAVIEEVTITGAGTVDETVRMRGVFSLATGRNEYKPPIYGDMLFRLKKGDEEICRKEWADLKRMAGTGQVVAFSGRYLRRTRDYAELGRVYKPGQEPAKSGEALTPYSSNIGVQKVRISMNYLAHRRVACFPMPSSPVNATVKAGEIRLVARNAVVKERRIEYFFEIATSDEQTESSSSVAPGKKETSWTPKMTITPGQKYSWRVWTVIQAKNLQNGKTESWKSPVATVEFQGKK